MDKISSYVPESDFYLGKDQYAPVFWEDLGIMDVRNDGRILSSREADIRPSKSVFQNDDSVATILHFALQMQEKRGMFSLSKKTVLLFADSMTQTGMVLVAILPERIEKVIHGLRRLGRTDFPLPKQKTREPELTDEQIGRLSALLFHADSFFSDEKGMRRMTQILRIADFAGCRIDFADLLPERLQLQDRDDEFFRFFLLCVFLQLRARSGKVSLKESEGNDLWKVTVGQRFLSKPMLPSSEFSDTISKAFPDFRLSKTEDGLFAEASLHTKAPFSQNLYSGFSQSVVRLFFSFSIFPKTLPEPMEVPIFTI